MARMARVCDRQGKINEATLLYQEALDGYERVLGLQHPSTRETSKNLASFYERQGDSNKAELLYYRLSLPT